MFGQVTVIEGLCSQSCSTPVALVPKSIPNETIDDHYNKDKLRNSVQQFNQL